MKPKQNYSGIKGKAKFITTAISWSLLIILILVASFLAYYLISTRIYAQKGEKYEPYVALYNVITQSMVPNINPQDVVLTVKVKNPDDIKIGDVITFYSTSSISMGKIITHRVVELVTTDNGVAYRTKGDFNTAPDTSPAEFHNVIGKVVLRIPQLGRVQSLLASKGGWLILIVIPALAVIISDILKLFHLTDIKKKVTVIEQREEQERKLQETKEEERKKELRKKLKLETSIYEPDPIEVNKPTRIVIGESVVNINKDDIDDNQVDKKKKKKSNKKNKKKNLPN